jgi:hypothetical protein
MTCLSSLRNSINYGIKTFCSTGPGLISSDASENEEREGEREGEREKVMEREIGGERSSGRD